MEIISTKNLIKYYFLQDNKKRFIKKYNQFLIILNKFSSKKKLINKTR